MKTKFFSRTAIAVSATLLGGIGVAYAADLDWYSGGNATVADPDSVTTLKFYNASGTAVTSGSTTDASLAAFAAADSDVRSGDSYGTLFAYTPSSTTAPGAWTGTQISGTTKFAGSGAEAGAGSVSGKQFHKGTSSDTSLADYIVGYPNESSSSNLANIYEIRLRTSSASGFGADYASGFVKVSGSTWTQVAAPTLGESEGAIGTTTAPGTKAITYGTATTIPVTVTAASGTTKPVGKVEFLKGATKLGEAAVSATTGIASVPLAKTALLPGSHALTFKFVPTDANAFEASEASKSYTVAKRSTTTVFTITKAPTSTKAGSATVTVKVTTGLPAASGKVEFRFRKYKSTKVYTSSGTLSSTGKRTFTIAKKAKGSWEYSAKYTGSARYLSSVSAWKKVTVTK